MKPVEYRHSWNAKKTTEQEMAEKFGTELHYIDTNQGYETSESFLFKKGRKYTWLTADGCSCWDGDYLGWELTLPQLLKLAQAKIKEAYKERHEYQMAEWIMQNVKAG